MADPAAITETVTRYLDRLAALDKEGWLALWTDDATMEDPVGSPLKEGKAAIGEFIDGVAQMVDGMETRLAGPVNVCGNEAAFQFEIRPLVGGERFVVTAYDVMTFDDDARITSQRAFVDHASATPAED